MKVSIITPIYYGNRYLNSLLNNINEACSGMNHKVELILVNDSPDAPLSYDNSLAQNFSIIEIENNYNSGIHQSRVNGLKIANGDYIVFLDQDDKISKNYIHTQLQVANTTHCDIVLSNGYNENNKRLKQPIYKNTFSLLFATKERPYILARDFITSPGQCLIKKKAIPVEWTTHIMEAHGADDYFLWLLCFNAKCKIAPNYELIYTHKNTGRNYSANKSAMRRSLENMLHILEQTQYPKTKLYRLRKSINFKANYKQQPLKYIIQNPIIFLYNIYYRIVWRGFLEK